MKIKLVVIVILCIATNYVNAQSYSTAIGVKGGYSYYGNAGLNLKHDFGGLYGDFTIGGGRGYFNFSAIAEKQNDLSEGFEWYYGIGMFANNWRDGYYAYYKDKYYINDRWGVGALGVIGIEYTFDAIPINIGIDAGPAVSIIPYFGVGFGGSGFIRFAIK